MRQRYRYDKDLNQVVEIEMDTAARESGPFVLPDLDRAYKGGGFTSPIDGQFITSRSQLEAHNRKHGVRQNGDFKPGELINKEKKRVDAIRRASSDKDFTWH